MLLSVVPVCAAGWCRIQAPPFELFTDAGESSGRRILRQMQEMRRVVSRHWPESQQPLRILLLASEPEYQALRPSETARAFFQSSGERDYIVMYAGDAVALRAARHEYVHAVFQHTSVHLPKWLEEGLADFFSTAEVGSTSALLGPPVREHLGVLKHAGWLDAATLAAIDARSEEYNNAGQAGVFYAQSWAAVHMLMLGEGWRGGMPGFLDRLAKGEEQETAFEAAFARPWKEAIRDLGPYIRQRRLPLAEIALPPEKASAPPPAQRMTTPEAKLSEAEVALVAGRPGYAEEIYRSLAQDYPLSPQAATGLASIAMQRHDYAESARYLKQAMELGARDASTLLEYAMLIRDSGGRRSEVLSYLRQAAEANPRHPEVRFLLGLEAASEKRYDEALLNYRAAVEVLPRQSSFWHALAMTLIQAGRREEAVRAARNALEAAVAPPEREMAEMALALTKEAPEGAPPRLEKPDVVVPDSWKPRHADHRVIGRLTMVECKEDGARLHIEGPEGPVVLVALRPAEIELKNWPAASRAFPCGKQPGTAVAAAYTNDKELVSLDFTPQAR